MLPIQWANCKILLRGTIWTIFLIRVVTRTAASKANSYVRGIIAAGSIFKSTHGSDSRHMLCMYHSSPRTILTVPSAALAYHMKSYALALKNRETYKAIGMLKIRMQWLLLVFPVQLLQSDCDFLALTAVLWPADRLLKKWFGSTFARLRSACLGMNYHLRAKLQLL